MEHHTRHKNNNNNVNKFLLLLQPDIDELQRVKRRERVRQCWRWPLTAGELNRKKMTHDDEKLRD